MNTIDFEFVRSQFPAFSDPSLEGFAFFENAGGSYACGQVIEALRRYYIRNKVQPGYPYAASTHAAEEMARAKYRLAAWLNVTPDEISIGPSTSQNTYVLAQALREQLEPGDEVIVTNQDHEANVGAWRRLEKAGVVVREWRIDPETAELGTAGLEALLGERTRVVAFTQCSNLVGSINPVAEWCAMARTAGALTIVDGVSFAPHGLPDVKALGADVYLFSLYKVYGPHQGVMVMREEVNRALPYQCHYFKADTPGARFVPAGPDHAQVAAVNGVMDYLESLHAHHFGEGGDARQRTLDVQALMRDAESANVQPVLDFLGNRPGVRLIGRSQAGERAPTVSFAVEGRKPVDIARDMARRNIGIGFGHCYAIRLVEALGYAPDVGVARISLVHYTSPDEVSRLLAALDEIL